MKENLQDKIMEKGDIKAFYYQDVKRAVLELLKIKQNDLIDIEEYKKYPAELTTKGFLDVEDVIEHNENIESDIFDIKRIFGDFN